MAHPSIPSHHTRHMRSVRRMGFFSLSSLVATGLFGTHLTPVAIAQALELPPPEGATSQGEEELPAPKSHSAAKKPASAHGADAGEPAKGEKAGSKSEHGAEHAPSKGEEHAPAKGEEHAAPKTEAHDTKADSHGAKADSHGAKAEEHGEGEHKAGDAHDKADTTEAKKPTKAESSASKGSGLVWFAVTFVVLVVAVFVLT